MKQEFENLTVILSLLFVVAIVAQLSGFSGLKARAPQAVQGYRMPQQQAAEQAPSPGPMTETQRQVSERFNQAIALLHAGQYEYAITALDSVLELAPSMPEAYVNMGYAFLGLEEFGPAQGAFETAINLKVDQVNAYYGLAEAFDGQKEYEAALGAMRSYIHLSPPDDPYLAKARAALWEWEAQLGRLPGIEAAPEGTPGISVEAARPQWDGGHGAK